MKIEYLHASVYGNGAAVAEEFRRLMLARGVTVDVHHVREIKPKEMPAADLYLFSSPGRFGKPIKDMRRFLKKLQLAPGTRYALLVTELAPQPDETERMPSEEELGKCQQVVPILNELLQGKGLVKVAEGKVRVTGIKGPLEEGWEQYVETFASGLPLQS
jgi:flavodoxin